MYMTWMPVIPIHMLLDIKQNSWYTHTKKQLITIIDKGLNQQ